jgi:hypothetical protein
VEHRRLSQPGSPFGWIALTAQALGLCLNLAASPTAGPDFSTEVRPILSQHCFKCHGPDDLSRKGNLRLDVRDVALQPAKSGAVALVPGKPHSSEVVTRIHSRDPDEVMPPPSTRQTLTETEKKTLEAWIAAGAEYVPHWAFQRPRSVSPPEVSNPSWARNPIDQFVLQRLQEHGFAPAEAADPHTLARRVSLDLTGLPPTPAEVEAFLKDPSDSGYELWVDQLLASPRYGERWGRRWMDLARYADTNGYEKDRTRSIWPWRDWVIRSLNADMPFDQFTLEQLAGDLLPNATRDQRIATGFHRNTMLNEEGGIDPLEFRFHAMTDRVATTGTTWLGLTVGCAQCHTHKYDPIPHREYYQLMAFLNNADEPDMDLPEPSEEARHRAQWAEADALTATLAERFPIEETLWFTPTLTEARSLKGSTVNPLKDQSALFTGTPPQTDTLTLVVTTRDTHIDRLRLETLLDEALPKKGPGRVAHGNFVLSELRVTAAPLEAPDQVQKITLTRAQADVEQSGFPAANAIDDQLQTGWAVDVGGNRLNREHHLTVQFQNEVSFPSGIRFEITLEHQQAAQHLIGRPRIQLGRAPSDPLPVAARRKAAAEAAFQRWLGKAREAAIRWSPLRPTAATSNLPLLTVQDDASVFVSGDISKSDTYELAFTTPPEPITAVRLEALPDARLPKNGPGLAYYEGPKGDFFLGELSLSAGGRPVRWKSSSQSFGKNAFGSEATAALAIDGDPQTGWSTAGREGQRHEAVFVPEAPIPGNADLKLSLLFGRHYACSLGRFRVSVTTQAGGAQARDLPPELEPLLLIADASLTEAQRSQLRRHFLLTTPELGESQKRIAQLRQPPTPKTTLVLQERPPENPRATFLHRRGEFLQPAERVEPGVISVIAPFPAELPRNRLGLARWLVSTNNPLTARVTVNRQWQAFFGKGLVRTTEDFGYQGDSPSHPELLDWLAVDFMRNGWSLKRLHKQIALSATYRQSSRTRADHLARDPDNRWLSRGPSVRLDAEVIRDAALKASGLLSDAMGGPGVYPPQPSGVMEAAWGGSSWPTSEGQNRYRRSLYTFAKRTAPFAMFNTFDAPTGESCMARRETSNTPLQALTLLNDVFFIEVSQAMGRDLARQSGTVSQRIQNAFQRCMTRPPTPTEIEALEAFWKAQLKRFQTRELDPVAVAGPGEGSSVEERAAWATLSRALLNLDEMITKG